MQNICAFAGINQPTFNPCSFCRALVATAVCYYWKVVRPCKQTQHRASLSSLYRKGQHQSQPGIESKLLFSSTSSHNHLTPRAFNICFFAFSATLTQCLSLGHDDTSVILLIDVIMKTRHSFVYSNQHQLAQRQPHYVYIGSLFCSARMGNNVLFKYKSPKHQRMARTDLIVTKH